MKAYIDHFSQELNSKVEEYKEHVLDQINQFEITIEKKDSQITYLKEKLLQYELEIEALKKVLTDKQIEINRNTMVQDAELNFIDNNSNLIIIYQPQDVFNFPKEIIRWYFNEVDFTRLSFMDLIASIQGLLKIADCETIDDIICYLSDSCLDTLKPAELSELLSVLIDYLEVQYQNQFFSPTGIYYFLESFHKRNWVTLLKENDFIQKSMGLLEDLIFQIEDSKFSIDEPLTLLKVYFDLNMHDNAKQWLVKTLKDMVPGEEVELRTQVEFLYISFCYELDEEVLDFFNGLQRSIVENQAPELSVFNHFQNAVNQQICIDEAIKSIQGLRENPPLIQRSLRKVVFDRILQKLHHIKSLQAKESPQQQVPKSEAEQIKLKFDDIEKNKSISTNSKQDQQSQVGEDTISDKWNEESDLRKLGYSTSLTNRERWDILINRALPKLGYRRVCQYLKWFIEQKSKIKQKDYSRAIAVWEMDLKRLNQYVIKNHKI